MRTKLIILTSIAMALVVMAFPTNKFQPKTVWEHYCKYTLHIHPSQATEDQYDYFLDCWSGDDEYQYLYDYYEKKYPEDNQDKAYQELIDQVNATYGDGGVLQFKTLKGIKNYFEHVTIETQELIPIGFKTALLNRETK